MDLKDIMAISGSNGLFRFISKARNGIVVENLIDKKRTHSPASAKISALEDIAIYTNDKEVPLKEILQIIFKKENGGQTIDPKSDNERLKKYFEEILPEYDKDRVYVSDIKKVYIWYNLLNSLNLINLEIEEETSDETNKQTELDVKSDDTNNLVDNVLS